MKNKKLNITKEALEKMNWNIKEKEDIKNFSISVYNTAMKTFTAVSEGKELVIQSLAYAYNKDDMKYFETIKLFINLMDEFSKRLDTTEILPFTEKKELDEIQEKLASANTSLEWLQRAIAKIYSEDISQNELEEIMHELLFAEHLIIKLVYEGPINNYLSEINNQKSES